MDYFAPGNPPAAPAKGNTKTIFAVLVVTVFVLMIAAVAIPCLIRPKGAAEESSAASGVHTLIMSEIQYQSDYGRYAPDIKALGGPSGGCPPGSQPTGSNACLIDFQVSDSSPTSPKSGYYFIAKMGPSPQTFVVSAVPVALPHKSFCGIDDGVVRYDASGSNASPTSYTSCKALPPIGE